MMPPAADLEHCLTDPADTPVAPMLPEFELLLRCCAQRWGQNSGKKTETLSQHCDWKRFISLAEYHGVIPLVYESFASCPERLPVRHLAVLRSKYEESVRKSLWFTSELIRILKHLEAHGIKAVPYKGPALAQILYGDVTARQFGDIDILVRSQDLGPAKNALATMGYHPSIQLNAREERAYIAAGYEYPFDAAAGVHLVELQWRILPRFYSVDFDMTDLFQKTEQVNLAGESFPTLCSADLLLVLCVHAAKHVWAQLSWVCDIAQLAISPPIDWDSVWHGAGGLGIRRIVALNFLLAHHLLGSALPIPIQRWLRKDHTCQILKVEVLRIIIRSVHYDTESLGYFRLMGRLRERIGDKVRIMQRLMWTPGIGEWSAVRLPERLSAAYRLVRFVRLARRIAAQLTAPARLSGAHENLAFGCGNDPRRAATGLTVDGKIALH
jgi:Uncharacterised nucleotidyltransferase